MKSKEPLSKFELAVNNPPDGNPQPFEELVRMWREIHGVGQAEQGEHFHTAPDGSVENQDLFTAIFRQSGKLLVEQMRRRNWRDLGNTLLSELGLEYRLQCN